ncbi:putative toxin-antitoxin system toxin component, PIN family [Candidatus Poribacteria bacterium]|nr:putative toxin-antitoxin system toxin component, PIN family [Candidatus Poribacteria bacterium]MYH79628.1 putative toxin-antitoxin system toxin component, PIN family [Candidatus Poribacteria bacterium]MYK96760.1 putative toxin-antitoxin system toxin component, PIN family [Candidatus Poribacteria bacterium]
MQPIVVYDTNILISGMVWGGVPYDCIKLAMTDNVEGVTCSEIIDEFVEKLTIKLDYSQSRISRIVTRLLDFLRMVKITNELEGITEDPDDDKVIECAVVSGATHIVTGDKKHLLPLQNYQGIRIVTAADFLGQFR